MVNNRGFSLVELMIVVAIIGILAAIAIPNFIGMQLRAKRAEVPGIVDALKSTQIGYNAVHDVHLALGPAPRDPSAVDKAPVPWTATDANWSLIGWTPDGDLRGSYQVVLLTSEEFEVIGYSDIDGDGVQAHYTSTNTLNVQQLTANDVY